MKKLSLSILLIMTLLLVFIPAIADEGISFSETSVSLYENDELLLVPNVSDELKGADIAYTSSNKSAATVNSNGEVKAVSKGSATITATIKTAKQTFKASVKITVLRAVTSVELNDEGLKVLTAEDGIPFVLAQSLLSDGLPEEDYETAMALEQIILLSKGKSVQLRPVLKPTTASDRTATIISSNIDTLEVNKQNIKGVEEGASIVTIASVSNPEIALKCGVLVVNPVTKVIADTVKPTIGVGASTQINVSFEPEDATFRAVQWTSESPKIASVDENGLVTGVAKGKTVIRAKALDGSNKQDTVTITVQMMPTSVEISGDKELSLATGKSKTVKATVNPTTATNRNVTWSSSDPSIAKVNASGYVTGVSIGSCDIIATSNADPDLSDRIHVSVIQEVTSIKFTQRTLDVNVGTLAFAQVEVAPANATNPVVTYTVDNSKVATVDENGTIHALAKGTTTIHAKATDGSGKSGTMTLNVIQPPESVTLDKTSVTINTGRSATLRATVLPKNANNTRVTWESTDTSIAKVNTEGQVTGVKAGTCQIICKAKGDESVVAIADVTVHQLMTMITAEERTLNVNVKETARIRWTVGPDDVTDPSVTLTSNKPAIATVDQDGTVHGIKRGECTITIKAVDGSNKSTTVRINVLQPVEGVYMEKSNYEVDVDSSVRLTAKLIPSDASNTKMLWHSMDESIATVSGKNTRPTVTGRRWGTVEITGYTEDGGYSASTYVTVQNYNTAIRPTDLYTSNNEVKLTLVNVSNLQIAQVEFKIECFDIYNIPLACNTNGSNTFNGTYSHPLGEGESTRHGRFSFNHYQQPDLEIGRVVLTVTGYRVQEGWRYDIPVNKQKPIEYQSPNYIGHVPTNEPLVTPAPDETQIEPMG